MQVLLDLHLVPGKQLFLGCIEDVDVPTRRVRERDIEALLVEADEINGVDVDLLQLDDFEVGGNALWRS